MRQIIDNPNIVIFILIVLQIKTSSYKPACLAHWSFSESDAGRPELEVPKFNCEIRVEKFGQI